jgi:hypothetical protein
MACGASQVKGLRRTKRGNWILSKAVKHHWYGDTSPWTEQGLEDAYGFKGTRSRPSVEVAILDRENPPEPRSTRIVDNEG